MMLPELAAAAMLGALYLYALLGGADFGGGLWDLLASGPRAREQRALVARAIGPVWEANHVWLIILIVIMFTAFPLAFSVASTALHIPLTLMLLGIVARGAAFSFRHYGSKSEAERRAYGRLFAGGSAATPIFLGVVLGAVTAGRIRVAQDVPTTGFVAPWLHPFPFLVGFLTLAVFAHLAAVYLTFETTAEPLRQDFRRRALAAGIAVAVLANATALGALRWAPAFAADLLFSAWSFPLLAATAAAGIAGLWAVATRRDLAARVLAAAQTVMLVTGWAAAQWPHLIAPDVTLHGAAAPPLTLELLLAALAAGSVLLFPSLYALFRIFKGSR